MKNIIVLVAFLCIEIAHSQVIYDSMKYKVQTVSGEVGYLELIDKIKEKKRSVIDCYNEDGYKFNGSNIGLDALFYPVDIKTDFMYNRYLRFGFDLSGIVDDGERQMKHVLSKCALLDLKTANIVYSASAKDDFCYKDNYMLTEKFGLFPYDLYKSIERLEAYPESINEQEMELEIRKLLCNVKVSNNRDRFKYIANGLNKMGYFSSANLLFNKLKSIQYVINKKSILYKDLNRPTKMYLIKGDKITLLDEKTDEKNQKWYFINYKGKKDLNMWVKAEAIDVDNNFSE